MTDTYEWGIDVPLLNNSYMVMDILFVILGSAGALGVILFLVTGGESIIDILEILVIAVGGLIVLAFLVIGTIFLNRMDLVFKVDGAGVRCDLGEYTGNLNRLAWKMGSISQRINPFSSSLIAKNQDTTFVPWGAIEKAVFDGRKRVISVSSARRLLLRVYCTPENYDGVAKVVEEMLPDLEIKLI